MIPILSIQLDAREAERQGKVSISYLFSLFLNKMGNKRVGFATSRFKIFSFAFVSFLFIL